MGFLMPKVSVPAPPPPPPPPPAPPTQADASVVASGAAQRAAAAAASGLGADQTILTGGQGTAAPATAGKALTGE